MAVNINRDQIIGLIIDEYLRLENFNENHELLNYIIEIDNNGFKLSKSRVEDFMERFANNSYKKYDYPNKEMFRNYYLLLKKVSDVIDNYRDNKK